MIASLEEYIFTLPIKHLGGTHNLILMQQVKDIRARYWYMVQSIASHWKTRYLQEAIRLNYYGKHGALANNFTETLPALEADEVKSLLKDPYIFDMLTFTDQYNERDVEIGLVKHIEKFLVELGAGFAFMGRQYHIEVSDDDYYIDILMYNTFLHRYLVIDLLCCAQHNSSSITVVVRKYRRCILQNTILSYFCILENTTFFVVKLFIKLNSYICIIYLLDLLIQLSKIKYNVQTQTISDY